MRRLFFALLIACFLSVTFVLDSAHAFDFPFKQIEQQLTEKKCGSSWGLENREVAYIMVYLPSRQTVREFCYKIPMLRSQVSFASWSIRKLNRIHIADLEMGMFRVPLIAFDPPNGI